MLLLKFLKNTVTACSAAGVAITKLNYFDEFLYNMYRAIMPDKFIVQSVSMFRKLKNAFKSQTEPKITKHFRGKIYCHCPPASADYTAQIHTKWGSDLSQFTVEIFKGTFCNISYCIVDITRTYIAMDVKHLKSGSANIITLQS